MLLLRNLFFLFFFSFQVSNRAKGVIMDVQQDSPQQLLNSSSTPVAAHQAESRLHRLVHFESASRWDQLSNNDEQVIDK
jgi:hypothetical protein